MEYVYLVIIASAIGIITYILWSFDNDLRKHKKVIEIQEEQIWGLYSRLYKLEDKLNLTEAVKVKYE